MYIPPHFAWTHRPSLVAFCRAHHFATVIASQEGQLQAQHIPLLVDEVEDRLELRGHVAIGNPLWQATRVLAIFTGPHAYVSAALENEADQVPTWNYLAVHASGSLVRIQDAQEIRASFEQLGASDPRQREWQARLSEPAYQQRAQGIRWFRIRVDRLDGKAKLSQNHPEERLRKVIAGLAGSPDPDRSAIALAMERALAGQAPWPG